MLITFTGLKHKSYTQKHEDLLLASKEFGLEINTEKITCRFILRLQDKVKV
jgi:hypothetical protein